MFSTLSRHPSSAESVQVSRMEGKSATACTTACTTLQYVDTVHASASSPRTARSNTTDSRTHELTNEECWHSVRTSTFPSPGPGPGQGPDGWVHDAKTTLGTVQYCTCTCIKTHGHIPRKYAAKIRNVRPLLPQSGGEPMDVTADVDGRDRPEHTRRLSVQY